ncbi:MAG: polysaccharide biosynthesis/export family protein [Acidobacteria bacterium]|nr:polysaccharide biosynthesis/export family protein [Acidobacteriota bacterium]
MTDALAWALVHFLWQGAALAGVAWVLMRLTSSASARYVIGVTTMAAMVIALGATFVSLIPLDVPATVALSTSSDAVVETAGPVVDEPPPATFATPAPVDVPFVLPTTWVLSVWAVGVCFLSVRVFGGWCLTRRIARHAGSPVGPEVQHLAKRISARLGIRRVVQVVESSRVAVPMMIGWLRPIVLMPPAALAGLSPVQLEAILAHEFAHIRRHDYLVNLLQTVVETTLFFHPAVWWLSREIRRERELCCDDLAVSVCDRVTYATALSTLAHIRQPSLALAATDGALRDRVRRIITPSSTESAKGGWMAMLPIALVVLLAAPAALSSEPPTITAPSVPIDAPQIADVDDLVVTADPVTHTATVEPPAPVSRPALPMVRDFFMPPVQAVAWQVTPPPPSQAPTPAPYRVRVGDDIRLAWYNLASIDSEMSSTYRVETDGTIALKYVGAARVVGKTTFEVQDAVLSAFVPRIYREGVISVAAVVTPADELKTVIVQGRVNRPGEHRLGESQMTVSQAIEAAGGFTFGAGQEIEVRHYNAQVGFETIRVTRARLEVGDDLSLLTHDTVIVPERFIVFVQPPSREVTPGDTVTIALPETPALLGDWVLQADGSMRRQGQATSAAATQVAPQQAPAKELVFFVNGEVNEPGQKVWAEGMTVEKALGLAKGMTSRGKLWHIMRPVRDENGAVLKYDKISNLKPDTEILPDDELVITFKWWGN